jgi:hypothetical protein
MNSLINRYGGTVVAAFIIGLSVLMWRESLELVDSDSFIFPRVILLFMGITASFVVIRDLFWKSVNMPAQQAGSNFRRLALVCLLLATVALIPTVGMGFALAILMVVCIELSRFESWSLSHRLKLHAVGLTLVILLTWTFRTLLYVPLPVGILFK